MKPGREGRRMEALYRYRGVGAIVAVPLLLILTVLLVMPRGSPFPAHDFSRAQPFSRTHYEGPHGGGAANGSKAAARGGGGAADDGARYAIVVDAGSTGSRVHIFKFLPSAAGGGLDLQYDKFDQLKPGLSAFADDPPAAAASLAPLLDLAEATIPPAQHAATSIQVGATAGLRLLPDGKADDILAEVRAWLRGKPFKFSDDDVKILSGVDEGAFAWLTLNYLLGKLGGSEDDTVASIDLGGGSVQEAYAMTAAEAKAAPDPQYLTQLKAGGRTYHVYVYSYLGYGLMAARAAVLSEEAPEGHPCVPAGHSGTYEYAGKTMDMRPHPDGTALDRCEAVVLSALKHRAQCGAPQLQCTFNGAWGGPRVPKVFYISSYFWDRATDAGLIKDAGTNQLQLSPSLFGELAHKACGAKDVEALPGVFPKIGEELRPFFCLDLSYAHTLLTRGFKIPDDAQITLVKRVQYNGDLVEAAWPLGAAINALG